MTESERMAYVAYCGDCKGMVAAAVDDPQHRRDTAKDVAQWMRDGCTIERVTCQYVRENLRGCTDECPCQFCAKRRAKKDAATQGDLLAVRTESELFAG